MERNEYLTHLQNLRKAHKIVYRNLENIVMFKANQLIDQKLIAMKKCVEKEVSSIYAKMVEISKKYAFKELQQNQAEPPEISEVNMTREMNRKLCNLLGQEFINSQEQHTPGFTDDLRKYCRRMEVEKGQQFHDTFQYNLFTFERHRNNPQLEKCKEELESKNEVGGVD